MKIYPHALAGKNPPEETGLLVKKILR